MLPYRLRALSTGQDQALLIEGADPRLSRQVTVKSQRVEVAAPRELVFQVVASAGKKVGEIAEGRLVEFETRWRGKVIKTIEVVTLEPPTRIGYRWVEGRLDDVEEQIVFEASSQDLTVMNYSGRLGTGGGMKGLLRTVLFVRPIFNRLVKEHLRQGKQIAEKRALRSRTHPRPAHGTNN